MLRHPGNRMNHRIGLLELLPMKVSRLIGLVTSDRKDHGRACTCVRAARGQDELSNWFFTRIVAGEIEIDRHGYLCLDNPVAGRTI
jgi:hypothetical protein